MAAGSTPTAMPAMTATRRIPARLDSPLATTSAPSFSMLPANSPMRSPTSGSAPTTPSACPVSCTAEPILITSAGNWDWAVRSCHTSTPSTTHTTTHTTTPASSQRTERALRNCVPPRMHASLPSRLL